MPTPPTEEYKNVTGAFEGAGYVPKGVYRPAYSCLMRTLATKHYCEVCEDAVRKMILFYAK